MGIELPAELTAVAAKAGVSWPKADEDAMRSSATAWREAGDKIKSLGTSSDGAANRALGGMSGGTADAARGRWAKVVAPDGDFHRAARGCHAAADRLDHAAKQVGAAKVEIVRELVALAKNNDAATASASAGNPAALLGLDTLTKGAAANVANLQSTLTSAIRLDSGIDMSQGTNPVNTAPGAHGPGGLLSPVTDIVGGVVAPVAGVVAPVVEPVAAVVAPVTEAVAPVVGAVTAPVAPVVGAVTAPLAPVVGAVTEVAAPVLDAAAPVTAPVAAVVQPVVDAVPGGRDGTGPVFDGRGDGDGQGHGDGQGRGEGSGRGEGKGPIPGLVADTGHAVGQAVGQVVAPVAQPVADAIPSVAGTLGPITEGTTQASAAVLDPTLVRGGELPGQAPSAPQASAPAAQAAPAAAPAMGAAPAGGPIGGAAGGVPVAASQVGAVVGQQGAAQAPGQHGQAAQAAQQSQQAAKPAADAKATELKSGEVKPGEAKAGAQAAAAKTGFAGAAPTQALGNQPTQFGGQTGTQPGQVQAPGHSQSGTQVSAQAQSSPSVAAKDSAAKDLAKDAADALLDGDVATVEERGERQVGDTIASPAAPGAEVDLGAGGTTTSGPLAAVDPGGSHALSDRLENRNDLALANPGIAGEIARHTYTAAAAGSWFMAVFLSAGRAPSLAPKPARQLPPPPQAEEQAVPRFAPDDHPQPIDTSSAQPAQPGAGLGKDHPIVQELLAGHDPLAGMHERDWESLFQHEDGTPRWPAEREGGYEDSRPEILQAGAELDRFGTPEGRVLSAAGTPFAQRSLPPQAADEGYRRYRVTRDLPVHRTISAPWFGQPGGGSRYRTTHPVADLVALGYLTEITA
ncbi:TNT domain-containing protein [Lentzea sp. BCCO 10_0798]|uniref:TNT domain-containing protein n=1 Tax=Lentzea kristufekii TaxID=3095430 RepID=A0ABU4TUD9_9PSEU|nr:TNT domain-containing protein [Lentzea sp. BCCO 10_0798]MDX8051905.1 TNT domain-containing protein [Lentzea sp. BCCO 10_0798]